MSHDVLHPTASLALAPDVATAATTSNATTATSTAANSVATQQRASTSISPYVGANRTAANERSITDSVVSATGLSRCYAPPLPLQRESAAVSTCEARSAAVSTTNDVASGNTAVSGDTTNRAPHKRGASMMPVVDQSSTDSGAGGRSGHDDGVSNGPTTIKRARTSDHEAIEEIHSLAMAALEQVRGGLHRDGWPANNSDVKAALDDVSQALVALESAAKQILSRSSVRGSSNSTTSTMTVNQAASRSTALHGEQVRVVQQSADMPAVAVGDGAGEQGADQQGAGQSGGRGGAVGTGGQLSLGPCVMRPTSDQRQLAKDINQQRKVRERDGGLQCDCGDERHRRCANKWLAYSAATISALKRVHSKATSMERLLHVLRSDDCHVPQLRLFVSLEAQTGISAKDGKRRNDFWHAFDNNTDHFMAELRAGRALPAERDDEPNEKLLVSGTLEPGDETVREQLVLTLRNSRAEFTSGHASGDVLRAALIVRAFRLSANGKDREAIRLIVVMSVLEALHSGRIVQVSQV